MTCMKNSNVTLTQRAQMLQLTYIFYEYQVSYLITEASSISSDVIFDGDGTCINGTLTDKITCNFIKIFFRYCKWLYHQKNVHNQTSFMILRMNNSSVNIMADFLRKVNVEIHINISIVFLVVVNFNCPVGLLIWFSIWPSVCKSWVRILQGIWYYPDCFLLQLHFYHEV